MEATLKYLTSIQPPRNYKNIDPLNRVADYLKKRFESFGLQMRFAFIVGIPNHIKGLLNFMRVMDLKDILLSSKPINGISI
ncbi:MAG: hypothetical protein ACLFQJ_09435 [Campylobacterales bacterium]